MAQQECQGIALHRIELPAKRRGNFCFEFTKRGVTSSDCSFTDLRCEDARASKLRRSRGLQTTPCQEQDVVYGLRVTDNSRTYYCLSGKLEHCEECSIYAKQQINNLADECTPVGPYNKVTKPPGAAAAEQPARLTDGSVAKASPSEPPATRTDSRRSKRRPAKPAKTSSSPKKQVRPASPPPRNDCSSLERTFAAEYDAYRINIAENEETEKRLSRKRAELLDRCPKSKVTQTRPPLPSWR